MYTKFETRGPFNCAAEPGMTEGFEKVPLADEVIGMNAENARRKATIRLKITIDLMFNVYTLRCHARLNLLKYYYRET